MNLPFDMVAPYTALIAFTAVWAVMLFITLRMARAGRLVNACRHTPPRTKKDEEQDDIPLSVVVTTHNQSDSLRRNLPLILEQDYANYEVLVVDSGSTDDTEDVLKELALKYPHLTHTSTPRSARYISFGRLALSLGLRGARHQWVILTQADCRPHTPHWLNTISQAVRRSPEKEIWVGYANYQPSKSRFGRKATFFRLFHALLHLPHCTHHALYRGDAANWVFKKEVFLRQGGFPGHVHLMSGAEELLMNHTATRRTTGVLLHPNSYVWQELPSPHFWLQERVYYMETRRHFRHKFLFRLHYAVAILWPWVCLLTFVPALTGALLRLDYVVAGIVGGMGLLLLTAFDVAFNYSTRALGERPYHLRLPFLVLSLPLRWLATHIAYKCRPRSAFLKKMN